MHIVWKKISAADGESEREAEHREAAMCAQKVGAELMETLLKKSIFLEHTSIIKDEWGKPSGLFDDGKTAPIAFSLSLAHSFPFVLAAAAPGDALIGADVERVRPLGDEFIAGFLTEEEQIFLARCLTEERQVCAIKLWSLKEAILKALGVGLRISPKRLEVKNLLQTKDGGESAARFDGKPLTCRVWQETIGDEGFFCVVALPQGCAILSASRRYPQDLSSRDVIS